MNIQMTDFALRHFPKVTGKSFGGTKVTDMEPDEFVERLCNATTFHEDGGYNKPGVHSIDPGYADFCKSICVDNFTNARTGVLEIALENYQYLRSGYSARREGELPVLSRWFELPLGAPKARYLRVIVYSKEQLIEEHEDSNSFKNGQGGPMCVRGEDLFTADWGIVAVLGQMEKAEEPMAPATMLRNAMGRNFGGSGVKIDEEKYNESVEFWDTHANVK